MNSDGMQHTGIIIRAIAGFYYVRTDEKLIIECRARGILRKNKIKPFVGDNAIVSITGKNEKGMNAGIIESIQERKNLLERPPIANIDQIIVVFTIVDPKIDLSLVDRILMMAEYMRIKSLIIINKVDLYTKDDENYYRMLYEKIGYDVILISTVTLSGIEQLKERLLDKTSVLIGPSGVGKSSILNILIPGINIKTGEVSEKIRRGKHTTTHCQLVEADNNSLLVDTPGFSLMNIKEIKKDDIQYTFKEFESYIQQCRFVGCLHYNEPDCAVKKAVDSNKITKERYKSYINCIDEC